MIRNPEKAKANCDRGAECTYPLCDCTLIQSKKIGLVQDGLDDKGKPTYKELGLIDTYKKVDVYHGEIVTKDEVEYFLVKPSDDPLKVEIERVSPFSESTKLIEITRENMFPRQILDNFLTSQEYQIYAKGDDKIHTRKLYEEALEWNTKVNPDGSKGCIGIQREFVWKSGGFQSYMAIVYPIILAEERFVWILRTSQAPLTEYSRAMTAPTTSLDVPDKNKAPTISNLSVLNQFLEKKAETPETASPPLTG